MRSPDQIAEQSIIVYTRVTQASADREFKQLADNQPSDKICSIGFTIFPAGFIVDGYFITESEEVEEEAEVYETDMRVLH